MPRALHRRARQDEFDTDASEGGGSSLAHLDGDGGADEAAAGEEAAAAADDDSPRPDRARPDTAPPASPPG